MFLATVYVENQNSFRLRGRYATLAGKPDLIAVKHGDAVIIHAKTGRPSPHHTVQVMIYQYAVPKALEQYQPRRCSSHCPRRRDTPSATSARPQSSSAGWSRRPTVSSSTCPAGL